jgi:hypothetical protein
MARTGRPKASLELSPEEQGSARSTTSIGRGVCLSAAIVGVAHLSGACRNPTEIQLDIWTNVPCTDSTQWHGIAVYTGDPGLDLEDKAPAMTSPTCDSAGHVGTLVVTPSGADNEQVGIRVVAGLAREPEDCGANGYAGCIVARRTLNYVPHETTPLRIDLDSLCIGQGCDLLHTCVNGACDDARLTSPQEDSAVAMTVRCGDNSVQCSTTGNVCCLHMDTDAGTLTGSCVDPVDCPPEDDVLRCDDDSDCPGGTVCCVGFSAGQQGTICNFHIEGPGSGSACVAPANCDSQEVLCVEGMPCPTGTICEFRQALPDYRSCCLMAQ